MAPVTITLITWGLSEGSFKRYYDNSSNRRFIERQFIEPTYLI